MDNFNVETAVATEEKDGKPLIMAEASFNVDNAIVTPPRPTGIYDPKGGSSLGEAPPRLSLRAPRPTTIRGEGVSTTIPSFVQGERPGFAMAEGHIKTPDTLRIGQMEQPSNAQFISGLVDIGMTAAIAYSGVGAVMGLAGGGATALAAGKTLAGMGAGIGAFSYADQVARPHLTEFIGKYLGNDTAPARDTADLMATLVELGVGGAAFGAVGKMITPFKTADFARAHEALQKMGAPRQVTFHPNEVKAILGEVEKPPLPSVTLHPDMVKQANEGTITPEIKKSVDDIILQGGGELMKTRSVIAGSKEFDTKAMVYWNDPKSGSTLATTIDNLTPEYVRQKIEGKQGEFKEPPIITREQTQKMFGFSHSEEMTPEFTAVVKTPEGKVATGASHEEALNKLGMTKGETDPLIEEAKKYKSAEEFVKNISPKSKYSNEGFYQHILLRADSDIQGLLDKGFKKGIGPNAVASWRGEPSDAVQRKYQPKKGQTVILIPEEYIKDTANGPQVKEGYIPSKEDVVTIQKDGESPLEARQRQLTDIWNKAHEGEILKPAVEGKDFQAGFWRKAQLTLPGMGEKPSVLTPEEREDFIKTLNISTDKRKALSLGKHYLGATNQQLAELMKKPYWNKISDVLKNPPPPPEIDPATGLPKEPNKYVLDRPVEFSFGKNDKATSEGMRKEFSGLINEQTVRGNLLREDMQKKLSDKFKVKEKAHLQDLGSRLYIDLGGNMERLNELLLEANDKANFPTVAAHKAEIKEAFKLSPKALDNVKEAGIYYKEAGEVAKKNGVIKEVLENYANRIYKPEPPQDFVKTEAVKQGGIKRSTGHAKHRVFKDVGEAWENGKDTVDAGLSDLVAIHNEELARVNVSRKFLETMSEKGLGAWHKKNNIPDGWAQVGQMEKEFPVKDKDGNPVLGEDGNQLTARSIFTAPKGIAEGLRAITEPNFVKMMTELSKFQKYQGAVKMGKLSLSFFHHLSLTAQMIYEGGVRTLTTDTLRMNKILGSAAFKELELDATRNLMMTAKIEENQDVLRKLVQTDDQDFFSKLSRLPVLKEIGGVAEKNTRFLFGKLQRFYKVSDYGHTLTGWYAKHPEASLDEIKLAKQAIATHINNVYGGLNWQAMGMTRTNLSLLRNVILAPDWTIANYELLKSAFAADTKGALSRKHIITAIVGGMIATELINKQLTGHFTDENKPGHQLEIQIAPDVYISLLRGGVGDISKLGSMLVESGVPGLARFAQGKLSPVAATASGVLSQTKYSGVPISKRGSGMGQTTLDNLLYIAGGLSPIPIGGTGLTNYLTNEKDKSFVAGAAVAVGLGRYSKSDDKRLLQAAKSEAQKKIYSLYSQGKTVDAEKEATKFNEKQIKTIQNISKEHGLDEAPSLEVIEKYFITNIVPKDVTPKDTDVFAPTKKSTRKQDKLSGIHTYVPYGSKVGRKKIRISENISLAKDLEEAYQKEFENQ